MKVPGTRITDRRKEWERLHYNGADEKVIAQTILQKASRIMHKFGMIRLFKNERFRKAHKQASQWMEKGR